MFLIEILTTICDTEMITKSELKKQKNIIMYSEIEDLCN